MVALASSTSTEHPACARVIAAARPFGPDPTTTASYSIDMLKRMGKTRRLWGRSAIAFSGAKLGCETHRHHVASVDGDGGDTGANDENISRATPRHVIPLRIIAAEVGRSQP